MSVSKVGAEGVYCVPSERAEAKSMRASAWVECKFMVAKVGGVCEMDCWREEKVWSMVEA